jgi:hypothetical protein
MKKMTVLLTGLMLFSCMASFPVQAEEVADNPAVEVQAGDINADGELGVTDVISLQKYVLNMTTYNSAQLQAADLNKDNEVDVYDLGLMKHTLLHTFEDQRTNEYYENMLEKEYWKAHWYEEDGVIYCHQRIEFEPYIPNSGTCDRMEILLALMYKYPDSRFAVEMTSWYAEDGGDLQQYWKQECAYLRENGIEFYSVGEKNGKVSWGDVKYAVLTAEQLNRFPVYEKAGYLIRLCEKEQVDQN